MKIKRLMAAILVGLVAIFSAELAWQLAKKENPNADRNNVLKL